MKTLKMKTPKIVLAPHGGSGNHGCEAIVRSTSAILGPGIDIELFSDAPAEDAAYGLGECCTVLSATAPVRRLSRGYVAARLGGGREAIDALTWSPVVRAARRGDLVLSIGGDNYCYGVNRHLLILNRAIRRTGARMVLWGCSVDAEALAWPAVRADLGEFDAIVARESITRDVLLEAGMGRVLLAPDPAFVMERRDGPLPAGWVEGGMVGINLSPMVIDHESRPGATLEAYSQLVGHILRRTSMSVALVPHVVWARGDDRVALAALHERFGATGRVVTVDDCPAPELKGVIARCRFFVAARTHASIAAYSTGVPTLVVGYSVKARGIARDIFGTERGFVVPVESIGGGGELVEAFEWLRSAELSLRAHYAATMPAYVARAVSARNVAIDLICGR